MTENSVIGTGVLADNTDGGCRESLHRAPIVPPDFSEFLGNHPAPKPNEPIASLNGNTNPHPQRSRRKLSAPTTTNCSGSGTKRRFAFVLRLGACERRIMSRALPFTGCAQHSG